jgi:MYXO-CTERM domain-containing protein
MTGGAGGQNSDGGVDSGLGGAGGKVPACVVPVTISTNDAGTISVNTGSGCADMSQTFGVSCSIGGSKAPASLLASLVMAAAVLARRRRR